MVLTSEMRSFTSWAMSLSPVEITTRMPSRAARSASVPITSSASTPSILSSGSPSASTASISGPVCALRSSGIGGRCALYSANRSSRKVRPGASKTTATNAGSSSFCSFASMLSTPSTAPVGSPLEFASGGSAWKARYRYEEPSTSTSTGASPTRATSAGRRSRRRELGRRGFRCRGFGWCFRRNRLAFRGGCRRLRAAGPGRVVTSPGFSGSVSWPLYPQPASDSAATVTARRVRVLTPAHRRPVPGSTPPAPTP